MNKSYGLISKDEAKVELHVHTDRMKALRKKYGVPNSRTKSHAFCMMHHDMSKKDFRDYLISIIAQAPTQSINVNIDMNDVISQAWEKRKEKTIEVIPK